MGTGKTVIGRNFKKKLGTFNKEVRKKAFLEVVTSLTLPANKYEEKFNEIDVKILNHEYLYIDLRRYNNDFTHLEVDQTKPFYIVRKILYQNLLPNFKILISLKTNLVKNESCEDILSLAVPKEKSLFIQFDEFDDIIKKNLVTRNTIESITMLYLFWKELSHAHNNKNILFYFSGRSPILYQIGKGSYRSNGITSPDICEIEWIFLRTLKLDHIINILSNTKNNTDLAELVLDYTSGIPRLITLVLWYLDKYKIEDKTNFKFNIDG